MYLWNAADELIVSGPKDNPLATRRGTFQKI